MGQRRAVTSGGHMSILSAVVLLPLLTVADPCSGARALLENGYVEAAEGEFRKLTSNAREKKCRDEGLADAAKKRCYAARGLVERDRLEEAKKRLDSLAESYPTLPCVLDGFDDLAFATSLCIKADALRSAGADAEAKTAYQNILKEYPDRSCAIGGLRALAGGETASAVKASVTRFVTAPLAPWLAILPLVAWALYRRYFAIRLDVGEFAPVKKDEETEPCGLIACELEHAITVLSQPVRYSRVQLVESAAELPKMPEMGLLPKEVGQFWEFVTKLFPLRTVTLTGSTLAETDRGIGIFARLSLTPESQVWGSALIRAADIDPRFDPKVDKGRDAWSLLARAVATWSFFQIHQQTKHPRRGCADVNCLELRAAFGTDSWKSHFHLQEAVRASRLDPDKGLALQLLDSALNVDGRNRNALYNRARLERQQNPYAIAKSNARFEVVRRRLESVLALSRELGGDGAPPCDATYIFSLHQIGQLYFDRAASHVARDPEGDLHAAHRHFALAAGAVLLSDLNQDARDDVEVPYATTLRATGKNLEAKSYVDAIEARPWNSPETLYNLACLYSCGIGLGPATEGDVRKAADLLDEAIQLRPNIERDANDDPALAAVCAYRASKWKAASPPVSKEDEGASEPPPDRPSGE